MMPESELPREAVVGFWRGRSLLSRVIRWQTRSPYSHVGWRCPDGTVIEAWAGMGVRHVANASIAHTPGTEIDWFDLDGLTESARDRLEGFLVGQLGLRYDYRSVFRFLTRGNRQDNRKAWFCSELIAAAMCAAGLPPLSPRVENWQISPALLSMSPRLFLIGRIQG